MRLRSVLLIGPLLPLCGCNLFRLAGHNLANETISRHDERKFDHRLESESRCVWRDVCRQYPARTFTPEFADGFTDGYVDYLDVGGTPRPPAVPPLRYRRSSYLTPHGHALVKDYLIGFQYGAEVAVATGKREFLTVPVLLGEALPEPPLNVARLPAPPEASLDPPGSVPKVTSPTAPPAVEVPKPVPAPVPKVPVPDPPVPRLGAEAPQTVTPVSARAPNSVPELPPLPDSPPMGVMPPVAEPPPALPPVAEPAR